MPFWVASIVWRHHETQDPGGTMAKKQTAGEADCKEKKVNPALMTPLQPSKELAAVVGARMLA